MTIQTPEQKGPLTYSVETVDGTGAARRFSQATSPAALGRGIGAIARKILGPKSPVVDRIAFVTAGLLIVLAIVGPMLAPKDPYAIKPVDALLPPGPGHWFGTDDTGRDILSRVLAGAPLTLLAAVFVVIGATLIGVLVASLSTLAPRWLDEVIMRICDMFMSIPSLVLALGLAAALGPSLQSIIVAMVAVFLLLSLAWVVVEIALPLVFVLAYELVLAAVRHASRDKHDCRGKLAPSLLYWASYSALYLAPVAIATWLLHRAL